MSPLLVKRLACCALLIGLWFSPFPAPLTVQAWHLFAIFVTVIAAVIAGALPILVASVFGLALSVLTGTITAVKAYSGFSSGTVLLVAVTFMVSRGVIKSGLGRRIAFSVVSVFGRSTMGLGYSVFIADALIAPAFPSNTARSGVLFPIVSALAQTGGSRPDEGTRKRMGAYLMFCGMASISLSSALWFTAMAGNPAGADIAKSFGLDIRFVSWLVRASVPSLVAILLLPLVLYKVFPPEVKASPEAPVSAREALKAMGPMTAQEKIVALIFAGMVTAWALAGFIKIDSTAVALLGFATLLAAGVLTLEDVSKEGDAFATFLWLGTLITLSGQLNELGFMGFVGERLALGLTGLPWPVVYVALVTLYVMMHYLFASQTAQVLALLGIFVGVGVKTGVPLGPLTYALLFASNHFSTITPQGSSANVIFAGSGYLTQKELYKMGAITTAFNLAVYLLVGTPWLLLMAK